MAVNGSLTSCIKLQTDAAPGVQQQQYYALVLTNTQQHTFDISVTDGQTAWRGTGLKVSRPPGFTEDEAWSRARELLTDINPSAKPATLRAHLLDGGQLQFVWSWEREVGAGRHVMKLPDPSAAAAAAAAASASAVDQQPPGMLLRQQPPHTTITQTLDTLVTSYGKMQACLSVCGSSQSSLQSSLEVLRGQLDSQAAAHKDRERELYLKFTMLLNQKTRQLQKEHEMVKQLSAEVERLKGEADADTDDEAMQAAYAADEAAQELHEPGNAAAAAAGGDAGGADTEPGSDEAPPAAAAAGRPPASAAAGRARSRGGVGDKGLVMPDKGLVIPDSEGVEGGGGLALGQGGGGAAGRAPAAGSAAAAAGGGGGRGGGDTVDVDYLTAETQMLPDSQLLDQYL